VVLGWKVPLAALLLCLSACDRAGQNEGLIPPSQRPVTTSVAYVDSAGAAHTLAEHLGKIVVVDVWATWCPPCQRSLPSIADLQSRDGNDYVVLAISVDKGGWDDVRPYLGANPQLGHRAALPKDGDALHPFGSIHGIPTTLIVDRQGRLRERWSGYYPGRAEKVLHEALSEP